MKFALFGASGETGKAVCAEARLRGLSISGLVRPGSRLPDLLEIDQVEGSLTSRSLISSVLSGTDAVVIVFGPRPPYTDIFCAEATCRILELAINQGIGRVLCQTGAMVGDYPRNRTVPFELMART